MKITRIDYPVKEVRKFSVEHDGKEYTCYTHIWCTSLNSVVTGDGKSESSIDITNTKLGQKILYDCILYR